MLLQILAISVSLSIDALGIGISYQLKGVEIPPLARGIIGAVSALIMWLSVCFGEMMLKVLPEEIMTIFGVVVLCIIGLAFIRNSLFGNKESTCDFNRSQKIDGWEAVILGGALSADSVSAGIAAAVLGLGGLWMPVAVGMMQVVFLSAGSLIIKRCVITRSGLQEKICGVFSGCLLILIAVLRGIG